MTSRSLHLWESVKRRRLLVGSVALAIAVAATAAAFAVDLGDDEGAVDEALAAGEQMGATDPSATTQPTIDLARQERRFEAAGFATDLTRTSIDLELVLSGGPGKDGIPALSDLTFTPPILALLGDDVRGILVEFEGERRFYPFNILVWHEIANDSIGDTHFAVTFCPLCGSGIVFDREVGGEILEFGVSGFLYESNLIMYDRTTESLWSQSLGEAVVGAHTGARLEILPMQLLTFGEARAKYPDMAVLSDDTGYSRDYGGNPYSGYDESESLMFPVSVQDKRFFAKELMYVFRLGDTSVAFPLNRLGEEGVSGTLEGTAVEASREGGEIHVTLDGSPVPGYIEMWFSWATQHESDGLVWDMPE